MANPNRPQLEVLTQNATIDLRETLETRLNTNDLMYSQSSRMRNRIDILEQQIGDVEQTNVVRRQRLESEASRSSNRWTTKSTSTASASGYKNPVRPLRESKYATEEVVVPRSGASLRASFAMACAYRRL